MANWPENQIDKDGIIKSFSLGTGTIDKQTMVKVLRDHFLVSVNCDHSTKTNRAQCSCSLVKFHERSSVGAAVDDWIAHVIEQSNR